MLALIVYASKDEASQMIFTSLNVLIAAKLISALAWHDIITIRIAFSRRDTSQVELMKLTDDVNVQVLYLIFPNKF